MCKRNTPKKNQESMGRITETPQIKKKKKEEASTGCVGETPRIQMKSARDV